jgi:hypothetical protein
VKNLAEIDYGSERDVTVLQSSTVACSGVSNSAEPSGSAIS